MTKRRSPQAGVDNWAAETARIMRALRVGNALLSGEPAPIGDCWVIPAAEKRGRGAGKSKPEWGKLQWIARAILVGYPLGPLPFKINHVDLARDVNERMSALPPTELNLRRFKNKRPR